MFGLEPRGQSASGQTLVDGTFCRAQGHRAAAGDLTGLLDGERLEIRGRHHLIDDPVGRGLGRREDLGGEDPSLGPGGTQQPRQALGSTRARNDRQ